MAYYLTYPNGAWDVIAWDGTTDYLPPEGCVISDTQPDGPQHPDGSDSVEQIIERTHAQTDALYGQLPIDVQGQFLSVYAGVKDAIKRGNFSQARAAISAQAVPPELDNAKAAILATIPTE